MLYNNRQQTAGFLPVQLCDFLFREHRVLLLYSDNDPVAGKSAFQVADINNLFVEDRGGKRTVHTGL
ncbi:Uncharacterised protein [Klebsiella pneumoniae]|nr:Uncharacterised protein [Klebsiella pneumoniae]